MFEEQTCVSRLAINWVKEPRVTNHNEPCKCHSLDKVGQELDRCSYNSAYVRLVTRAMATTRLQELPDIVLFNILNYLNLETKVNLIEVDERFAHLLTGKSIAK